MWIAVRVERDKFAVEHEPARELRELGGTGVMFQPRRLRIRNSSSVETVARKPSHFTS